MPVVGYNGEKLARFHLLEEATVIKLSSPGLA